MRSYVKLSSSRRFPLLLSPISYRPDATYVMANGEQQTVWIQKIAEKKAHNGLFSLMRTNKN